MNGAKLIHGLLVALLCYGQIVSSVHAVEHLELADCNDELSAGHHHGGHSNFSPFHSADHQHPPLADTHTHSGIDHLAGAQTSGDTKPDTGSHTELDCKIYHAFQNLNGIGRASPLPIPGIARQNTGTTHTLQHLASDSLEIPQIRAPPALS